MGLPISPNGITRQRRLDMAVAAWSALQATATNIRNQSTPNVQQIFGDLASALRLAQSTIQAAASISNMAAYATDQLAEYGYSGVLGTDIAALQNSITNILTLLSTNIGTIYGRYAMDATGIVTTPTLLTSEKTALNTYLDALLANF